MYSLHAENMLLKSQLKGLREVLRIEKRKKKPKKGLFIELHGKEGNAAIFFLPAKILAARELQTQKAKEIEEIQAQKHQLQLEKQQRKEEQAELKKATIAAQLEKKEKLALAKA